VTMKADKRKTAVFAALAAAAGIVWAGGASPARADVRGWLNWRGPEQSGVSRETGLPEKWTPGGENHLWTLDLPGGGTPVIADGRLYAMGYEGQGADLQEVLLCADAETGKKLWERRFNDFLSDIVYDRYAIGSPCVDAETGNVYALTSAGIFTCTTRDGKPVWQHSLMESLGRLTFTNGRTGGPIVEEDLVLVRGITSNWGAEGAAMDRFYAFDKKTGKLVWSCSPGVAPKDNSFARPIFGWRGGKRVFYTGAGDGSLICVNARTGETVWRYPVSAGGMNASVVLYKNNVIGIHADENLDSSDAGRMTAVRVDAEPKPAETGPPQIDRSAEAWRNDLAAISSSPVLVGNRLYQTDKTGHLCAVDADTGKILYRHKLAPDQLHASPLYADGKLYVPMQNGQFFILRPTDAGVQELAKVQLAGRCIGAPSAWNGKVYVHSTEKLYCFGRKGNNPGLAKAAVPPAPRPKPGPTAALQILPAEVALRPGETATFTVRGIDANGFPTGATFDATKVTWEKFVPPTARVKSEMDGAFDAKGVLTAGAKPSAGAFRATVNGFSGTIRGRVLPALPFTEDFESFTPTETLPAEPDAKFAYPPLPWIGARFKFDVRDLDGNKVLAKTLDNIFFQRATVFLGHPDEKNYTFEADVMSDGNRRTMSSVGVVNQRYYIVLNGNAQELEINSNQERIKATVPFAWTPKVWYRLKTRVDVAADGSGVVRAKAWKKGDPEPEKWTLEVPHRVAHTSGSPGLFGFSPQSLFRVYIDNISITPNR
jgi:FOG: WD40-like repeat